MTETTAASPTIPAGERGFSRPETGLASRSYLALLATQFLGSLNDNMLRWLAVPIAQPSVGNAEALSLGLVCFTVPYLLLATAAGYFADRFSKRTVIIGCKVAELAIMILGLAAIALGSVSFLFVVVALMGSQSALFAPAKFGSLPEMLRSERLSAGNGWLGLITIVAAALGTVAGYWLYAQTQIDIETPGGPAELWLPAVALIGVAAVGWVSSVLIGPLPAANPSRRPTLNPVTDAWRNLRLLAEDVRLLRCALGIAFFWMLASLAQINIDPFGSQVLGLPKEEVGPLLAVLVVGLGIGSVLAGLWSGDRVELGLVPLGATGIAVSAVLLFVTGSQVDPALSASTQNAWFWACVWLLTLGLSAGFFDIPLEAYLQDRSDDRYRGTILAASNFLAFSLILAGGGVFYLLKGALGLDAGTVFLVAGLGTIPVAVYVFGLLPDATIRCLVWLASHTIYKVRVYGSEHVPKRGGALLVANHVSWIDGVLLLLASSRPVRMVAYSDYMDVFGVRQLARLFRVIPIKGTAGPKAVLRALKTAREAAVHGEIVCIFAEGEITRSGHLQAFQRGVLRIIEGTDVPVVPTYLDGLWGSIFSYRGGTVLWKRPRPTGSARRDWRFPVSILFGRPLRSPESVAEVHRAVQELGVKAMEHRKTRELVLPRRFLRRCRGSLRRLKIADSTGQELTGGRVLAGTLALKRALERAIGPDERTVGLLLPPSVGGVLANASVSLMRRVAVNLNYTLSNDAVNYCIERGGIRHVITSRRFLEQRPFDLDAEVICLEDLREQITTADRALAAVQAYLCPVSLLERLHGLARIDPDEPLTIIFTSGATGMPKGVQLSQHNVLSNIDGIAQLFRIERSDVLLGILPFFHSFGYTATLWFALGLEPAAVYHFNPLDARRVGRLCKRYGVTIAMSTPTFLRSYLKRCKPEQFERLDLVIVGAEKLPQDLAQAFAEKFGVLPTEGYGTTELSPVAAVNVPADRAAGGQGASKPGTVGRPFPGVAAKVVDPETGEDLGVGKEGLLLIKGPNVMLGYLDQPEKTAEVLRDGWYNTGDFARIDADGFIQITGRQTRFSKIGGEMVPHGQVEEALAEIVESHLSQAEREADEDGTHEVRIAVTSLPDAKRGERLAVLHKPLPIPVDQLLKELSQRNLPNLWLPERESFIEVEHIPVLGSGKLDLKAVQQLAEEKWAARTGVE